jgi:hypothetical protein
MGGAGSQWANHATGTGIACSKCALCKQPSVLQDTVNKITLWRDLHAKLKHDLHTKALHSTTCTNRLCGEHHTVCADDGLRFLMLARYTTRQAHRKTHGCIQEAAWPIESDRCTVVAGSMWYVP